MEHSLDYRLGFIASVGEARCPAKLNYGGSLTVPSKGDVIHA